MTKEELIAKVAQKSELSVKDAESIIDAFTTEIKTQLMQGEKVTIPGFGAFMLSKRRPKTFVNPKNGQSSQLPERNLPHFKAGPTFKKNLQSSQPDQTTSQANPIS